MKKTLIILLYLPLLFSFCSKTNTTPLGVCGCTDSLAINYNALANMNDSSCTYPLAVGDSYQGGLIFYLDSNGAGLIAAPSDKGSTQWGCFGADLSSALATAVGTGAQNTIGIEVGCTTPGIAADICANLTFGGYSDWFLPSKDELDLMHINIGRGNTLSLDTINGFALGAYWSSSEADDDNAWGQDFFNGFQQMFDKNFTAYVRPIRAF